MKKCLICEKMLETGQCGVVSAGTFALEFGYSSAHDQLGYRSVPTTDDFMTTLLQSDVIQGYICDTCFPAIMEHLEGYNTKTISTKTTKDHQ
jgi:hypothetical protein